ncbi:hypothetical protein CR513_28517, partial [Mucuna pruriens]
MIDKPHNVRCLVFSMRKTSTMQSALLRFGVPLLLVITFCYATSAAATTQVSGNTDNEELAKTSLQGHDEEAKFKGLFPKPIPKPIPFVKPIPKPIPFVKPIPIRVIKPVPKIIPIVKPPVPKPLIVKKPIPAIEPESFLKPKPLFEKPVPKLPLYPKFKKPLLPPLPIQKPIPTP